MHRRLTVAVAATAALGLGTAGLVTTAGAAAKKNQIVIKGALKFRAGKGVRDNQRFTPLKAKVKSGSTVTLLNRSKEPDPHTISFVEKSALPTSFESGAAEAVFAAHQPEGEEGPSFAKIDDGVPAVDQAAPLAVNTLGTNDAAGDSEFIAPGQKSTKFTVTADSGSKLYYFCAIHPWMQGKIRVK